ncbi:MAG: hypothetical protein ACI379_16050 [Nocardioides sp.]|uniref:hypothetical protein n=1 Tax=Nocardioides sp. TaxID=35761 RepID=UPI003F0783AE
MNPAFSDDSDATDRQGPQRAVVVGRLRPHMLPLLARDVGSALVWASVDGWTVLRLDEAGADLRGHAVLRDEVPVVTLHRDGHGRWIDVVTHVGVPPGTVLSPTGEPPLEPDEVPGESAARVAASRHFAHLDVVAVAAAVESPDDEGWSARVLAALGLPVLAADVHEGRTELPGAVAVEPMGVGGAIRAAVRQYEDAPPDEVARRGALGRWQGAVAARPSLGLLTALPEAALGLLGLWWVAGIDDRAWWQWLVGALAALAVLDALADTVALGRRPSQRRAASHPREQASRPPGS